MADQQVNSAQNSVAQTVEQDHEQRDQQQANTEPLRNASPLPDSDTESEVSEEEIESHRLEQPTRHLATLQYYGFQALLWLHTLLTFLGRVATTSQSVGLGVIRSLQPNVYVFFKGSHYPYRLQDYTIDGPGSAPVEWYYNADTKQFISQGLYNSHTEYTTHHFEWLSGQIKYNELVLYDISDFLQQIRWASHLGPGTTRPSIAHVLAAWSLDSGKVLNAVNGLTLQTINTDGTESNLPCRG